VAEVAVDADSSSPVVETNWLPGTDDTEVALMESLPDITVLKPPEPPLSVIGFLTRDEERCLKYQINIMIIYYCCHYYYYYYCCYYYIMLY